MSYFESRLKVNFEDLDDIYRKLKLCEKLNIKNLILEPLNYPNDLNDEIFNNIKRNGNINIFYRFNLEPRNLKEYKKEIRNYNSFPYILSIETPKREIQIQAAKDSRIDILSFSNENLLKTVSPGVISLIKQNKSFIELSLAPIMVESKTKQSKNSRNLYRLIQLILKLKPNYIISGNFSQLYYIRHPRNLVSVCHTLLGMPLNPAKRGFKDNVNLLLDRVRLRINKKNIEEGVKLIKRGINHNN